MKVIILVLAMFLGGCTVEPPIPPKKEIPHAADINKEPKCRKGWTKDKRSFVIYLLKGMNKIDCSEYYNVEPKCLKHNKPIEKELKEKGYETKYSNRFRPEDGQWFEFRLPGCNKWINN